MGGDNLAGERGFERKLAAIFYADVASYSRLSGPDEEGTHRRLSEYLDLIAAAVEEHRGRVVHYAGDAVLADFGTVSAALSCAVAVQGELKARNEGVADDRKVRFRIGLHLGEVIVDRDDIYGEGVNIREYDDVFALQDELAETIVGALEPELGKAERERAKAKRPENLDGWDLYQRGLWHLYRYSVEDLKEAGRLFRKAAELDPNLGAAYSGLAESFYFTLVYGYSESPERDRENALAAARTAVELDGEEAVAHCALGRIHYARREHHLAIPELEIALDLNPSLAQGHYGLGASLVFSGRARQAIPHLQNAIRLSPRDPNMGSFLVRMADANLFMGNYTEAVRWAERALRQPNFQWSRFAVLISALGHLGRLDEAENVLSQLREKRPDFSLAFVQSTHLITDAADMDLYLDGLRKAGVS